MVTGGTAGFRMNVELLPEFLAELLGGGDAFVVGVFRNIGIAVFKIENFLKWTEMILRCAVAVQTPSHRVGLSLVNHFHLVNVAVAALARNAARQVSGVVEINVVRRLVDPHPFDRAPVILGMLRVHRAMKRLELRAVGLNVLVTVPTCVACRDVGMTGNLSK